MAIFRIPADYQKKVKKSAYDLSRLKRTTLHPGLIIPIYSRRLCAGEKFTLDINALLKSTPLNSPLYGSFRLQTAVFFDSDTNYYGWMDNNAKNTTDSYLSKHRHTIKPNFTFIDLNDDNQVTNPDSVSGIITGNFNNFRGSVLDFMGIPSGICPVKSDSSQAVYQDYVFDAGFILSYLNIFRNYFSSKQEKGFPYIGSDLGSGHEFLLIRNEPDITILDDFFMWLRMQKDGVELSTLSPQGHNFSNFLSSYISSLSSPYGGLLCATYLPDYFRNLLSSDYNKMRSVVTIDKDASGKTAGTFSIDTLRFSNKLQRLIDRIDISGGRFSDYLRSVWGVDTRKDMDIPELIGVSQSIIDPSQVTALAQTGEVGAAGSTDLGQFGGNFDNYRKCRKHSFRASTPGRVMVTVTLVPQVDYCQGVEPEICHTEFADDYYPEFDQLGFQKIPRKYYSCVPWLRISKDAEATSVDYLDDPAYGDLVVGKQVAWLDMMTDTNRVHGEFGNGGYYSSWVLQRRYTRESVSNSNMGTVEYSYTPNITHYINPLDYQYPFLAQKITDPNWYLQMSIDVHAVRVKGKRFMPNLE